MATYRGVIVAYDSGSHSATVRLDGSAAQTLPTVPVNRGIAAADVDAGDRCIVDTGDHNNPTDFAVTAVFGAGPDSVTGVPTGGISLWPTASAPSGYLLCDGSAVSRSTYAALFAVLSTAYGAGDGSTTFNVPNLKGRVPVGLDSSQTEFDALAETGGAKTHTLTSSEMPAHTHTQDAHTHTQNSHNHTQDPHSHGVPEATTDGDNTFFDKGNASDNSPAIVTDNATATNQAATATNQNATATNQNTGGGGAHNNLQPYIVLNYIIKT